MINLKDVQEVISNIINLENVIKVTRFVGEKQIVRATRKLYGKKIRKAGNIEITLVIGKPNYAERELIKDLKKKGANIINHTMLKTYNPKRQKPTKK